MEINNLPHELILEIFKYLPLESVIISENVCILWKNLLRDPFIWKNLTLSHSQQHGLSEEAKNELKMYTHYSDNVINVKLKYIKYQELIKILKPCKNISNIQMFVCTVHKDFEKEITAWPNLKKLQVKNSLMSAKSEMNIPFDKLKKLEYLELTYFGLTNFNFPGLLKCENLIHLIIDKIKNLSKENIDILVEAKKDILKTLRIYGGASLDDGTLGLIVKCDKLRDLAIIRCENITDLGFIKLTELKSICNLLIWNNTNITSLALNITLSHNSLSSVVSLSLSRIKNIEPVTVDMIAKEYKKIKFLALYQCPKICDTEYEQTIANKFPSIDVVLR